MAWYRAGTIALTNGSAVVVGTGTAWVANSLPGDILSIPGKVLEVKSITSDGQLELAQPYDGADAAGVSYALVPTQGYVPTALQTMQAILAEFGDIWQAWQAGDLQGRGLVLKGSVAAVADLPATGNTAGDGYIVAGSKLYVWNGTEWKYAGEMVTTTELIALRDTTVGARNVAVEASTAAGVDRAATEAARDESLLAAQASQSGAGIQDSFAVGVGLSAATTGPASFFQVKKGGVGPDGVTLLTRQTMFQRTGPATGVALYQVLPAGDFDALFTLAPFYEPDLCGWAEVERDKNGLIIGGKRSDSREVSYLTSKPAAVKAGLDVIAGRDLKAGRSVSARTVDVGGAGGYTLLDDDGMSGWLSVVRDKNLLIIAGQRTDGTLVDYRKWRYLGPNGDTSQAPSAQYVEAGSTSATYTVYTRASGKNIDVFIETLATGGVRKLTAGGRNTRPSLSPDGVHVIYTRESDGALMYVPAAGGTPHRAIASPIIFTDGDSMTSGFGSTGWGSGINPNSYPAKLAELLGFAQMKSVFNRGTNSLTPKQTATRIGAMRPAVTVVGDQIPAAGSVNATLADDSMLSVYASIVVTGTLTGVYGELARTVDGGQVVFRRKTAGAVVACPAGTLFQPDRTGAGMFFQVGPADIDEGTHIIWLGRNGWTDAAAVLAGIAAIVEDLKPRGKRFLVCSITTGDGERNTAGTPKANWDAIQAINATLLATYGDRFVDLQSPLIAAYDPAQPQDVTDRNQSTVPASKRSDVIHLNDAGYLIVAQTLYAKLVALGWHHPYFT